MGHLIFKRYFFYALTFIFFYDCSTPLLFAQVQINEFLASNTNLNRDKDFEERGDWIELYNTSNEAVNLSAYFLSDDIEDAQKWKIPNGTIISGQSYILFWADEKDTLNHTNFKLSKTGGAISLANQEGIIIDSILYTTQSSNISFGRTAEQSSPNFAFFPSPTPNQANGTNGYQGLVFYTPNFSIKGGLYSTPQTVELTTILGNIYYTLDGKEPTEADFLYTTPIQIDQTAVLRAKVFIPNLIAGKTITHSYFIAENLEERTLPIVSISTHPDHFWDEEIGIYTQDFKPTWEYPINIELFENDGDNRAAFNELAGIRINGNHSWVLPQKMMGIYFRDDYDKKALEYPLFFERDRIEFDNFSLRASGTDQSYTFFRDRLCQELTKSNMDLETQGGRPSMVYINGEYLGLFNIRSRQDEQYIEHFFNQEKGNYDLINNNGEVEEGDSIAFKELFQLLNADLSEESYYNEVAQILDIPNFTDYIITEIWVKNTSWGHNIKWWKSKASGSKWRMILKDLDRAFFNAGEYGIEAFIGENIPRLDYEWIRIILRKLLSNEAYKNEFIARFEAHLFTTFHPNSVSPIIDKMRGAIAPQMPHQIKRWAGDTSRLGDALISIEQWENEVADLHNFAIERATFMHKNIQQLFLRSDSISTLGIISTPANGGNINLNEFPIPADKWTGRYLNNQSISLEATAKDGHQFIGWSKGTFETLIPQQSEWKYNDNGINLGGNWILTNFDDSSWQSGLAQLGYGEGDENTIISFGNDATNKPLRTYFRKTFTIDDKEGMTEQLVFNLLKDDGAVIYLNGQEIFRSNMPAGIITANTPAYNSISGLQEPDFNQHIINTNLLRAGENVLAIAIHQRNSISSDLSFDLELKVLKTAEETIINTENVNQFTLTNDTVWVANFEAINTCILPEIIDQNTTLSLACSPYYAQEDVKVMPNASLIIEAGVEILMPEKGSLEINGDLQVNGTKEQPVIIRANEASGHLTWGNLQFNQTERLSTLSYLILENPTKGKHPIREDAAISAYFANLAIDHLSIIDAENTLVHAQYSNLKLEDSQLKFGGRGNMIDLQYGESRIKNCDLEGGLQKESNGIRLEEMITTTISRSKIHHFLGKNSNGIVVTGESGSIALIANTIHNCTDKGLFVKDLAKVRLINNLILHCRQGIGVKELAEIANSQSTIYNTETAIACFEKDAGTGGGKATVINSIFSNSNEAPFTVDEVSSIAIDYSCSDTEALPGANNLLANPLFFNPNRNNFHLLSNSPCKAFGISQNETSIDIGSTIFDSSTPIFPIISAINYNPSDKKETEFLEITNPSQQTIDISGFSFTEGVEYTFPNNTQLAPEETIQLVKDISLTQANGAQKIIQWRKGKLNNSGEMIRLETPYGIIADQIIYQDEAPWAIAADGLGGYLSLKAINIDNHLAENWEAKGVVLVATEEIIKEQGDIKLFPNPAHHQFIIDSPTKPIQEIVIFNAIGQQILFKNKPRSNTHIIDIENWTKGLYFVLINRKEIMKLTVN